MGYRVREHRDVGDFLDRAGPLLRAREELHTVMLSSLSRLQGPRPRERPQALLCTVERAGEVVAAAVRTPPRSLLLSAGAPPAAVDALAGHVHERDPALDRVSGLTTEAGAFAAALATRRDGAPRTVLEFRLFACEAARPPARPAPGRVRDAVAADADRLAAWLDAFTQEALPHERRARSTREVVADLLASDDVGLVLWEDGEPVAMLFFTEVAGASPRLGGVYTPPPLRGRGYASAMVAAVTQRLLDAGHRRTVLFTDLANPTSNSIYPAVGYRPVADFAEIEIRGVRE